MTTTNNAADKQNTTSYDYLDANHKRDRAAFYNKWEKRKEKDKRPSSKPICDQQFLGEAQSSTTPVVR